jgi:hypothetical protein
MDFTIFNGRCCAADADFVAAVEMSLLLVRDDVTPAPTTSSLMIGLMQLLVATF